MQIEENLKKIILERYGSMVEFAKQIDIPNTTLASIMNRGIQKASVANVIRICNALNISTDELAHGRISPANKLLDKNQTTAIEDILSFARLNIATYKDITIRGRIMSEDDKHFLIDTLEFSLQIIERCHNRKKESKRNEAQ